MRSGFPEKRHPGIPRAKRREGGPPGQFGFVAPHAIRTLDGQAPHGPKDLAPNARQGKIRKVGWTLLAALALGSGAWFAWRTWSEPLFWSIVAAILLWGLMMVMLVAAEVLDGRPRAD